MSISLEDRKFIKNAIEAFNEGVSNADDSHNPNLPSLSVWNLHQEYCNKILRHFTFSRENDDRDELCAFLEWDSFTIDAHEPLSESIEKAESYCKRIIKKLGI